MTVAVNPQTGETVRLDESGQWVATKSAKNPQTGETLALDGAEWKPVKMPEQVAEFARQASGMSPIDQSVARSKNDPLGEYLRGQASARKPGETDEAMSRRQYGGLSGTERPDAREGIVRGALQGLTASLGDEIVAGGTAALDATLRGEDFSRAYDVRLGRERQKLGQFRQDNPVAAYGSEIAGAVAPAVGLANAGVTLLAGAKPTLGSLAGRGAAEGAAYGAAHGFGAGEGGAGERAKSAALGAGVGAGAGALTGAGTAALTPRVKAPTVDTLKAGADQLYKAAEKAGVVIKPQSFGNVVDDIANTVRTEGMHPRLHPKVAAVLDDLTAARDAGQPVTLKQAEIMRRVLGSAAKSKEPDEGRIASIMIDKLDEFVDNLSPSNLISGRPEAAGFLKPARALWARARKSEMIETLVERAAVRADGQYTGAGFEHALRAEFKTLLTGNPARIRGFNQAEKDAMRKVVAGGPLGNAMRLIGKAAPRGVVSYGFSVGAGALLGDPLLGGSIALAGEGARRAATRSTVGNVNRLSDMARMGGSARLNSVPLNRLAPAEALIAAEGQQLPPLIENRLLPLMAR